MIAKGMGRSLAFALVLCLACSSVALASDDTALTDLEASFLNLINYDNPEKTAVDLTEKIGARFTGTFRRDMTVEYLMDAFRDAGYDPYIHEFTTPVPYVNGSIEMLGEKYVYYGNVASDDTAYKFSGEKTVTGAAFLSWPDASADLTLPDEADYEGKVVFVTMDGGNMPPRDNNTLFYNAAQKLQSANAGAVVFEYYQPAADGNTSYRRIENMPAAGKASITIPVGTALYHETHKVLKDLGDTTKIVLTMKADNRGKNVVAVLPSINGDKKTVYVTSHLDSQLSTPGMNDNASGVIMTLEMARAFRRVPFEHNVSFVVFDAEEVGLIGAKAFCADMTDEERGNFIANYNMDMIATSQADCIHMFLNISDRRLQALEETLSDDKRLIALPAAVEIAKEYEVFNTSYLAAQKTGFDMDYFNICYDRTTDHYAFVLEAEKFADGRFDNMLNAVEYDWRKNEKGTAFEKLYHKTGDTFEINYSRERCKMVSDIVALSIYQSAKAIEWSDSGSSGCDAGTMPTLALFALAAAAILRRRKRHWH